MEKFIDVKSWGRTDEYEIVNEFPKGYIVWNIGRRNFQHEGYIPLAKPNPNQKYAILLDGLKALKVESEELALHILDKVSRGGTPNKRWYNKVVKKFNSK